MDNRRIAVRTESRSLGRTLRANTQYCAWIGADEWFDKAEMLNDDYKLDRTPFLSCLSRAIERRQSFVKGLEDEVSRLQGIVVAWSRGMIEDAASEPISGSLMRERVLTLLAAVLHRVDASSEGLFTPPPLSMAKRDYEVIGLLANRPDRTSNDLLEPIVALVGQSTNILEAQTDDVERQSRLDDIGKKLDTAAERYGDLALASHLREVTASFGRQGQHEKVRSLSYMCRPWTEARWNSAEQGDVAKSAMAGLSIFFKAAQGQAASKLGLLHEAEEYLKAAAADAVDYDVPYVRLLAQQGLSSIGQKT